MTQVGDAPVAQVTAGRVDERTRRWLGLVSLGCLVLFLVDSYLIATRPLLPFDLPVALWVQGLSAGPLVVAMRTTNAIAGYWQVLVGGLVVLGFALFDPRAGWLMALGALSSLLDNIFKLLFERGRPTPDLIHILTPAAGYSFPSGHAVFYTWLAFMGAFGLAPRLHPLPRALLWLVAVAVVTVACLGRVWAGDHWPGDVLGGVLLGLGWSAFILWLPERWLPSPRISRRSRRRAVA